MNFLQKIAQDLGLIFGETTEQIFFQIRELLITTIQFFQQQIKNISDHPVIGQTINKMDTEKIIKSLEDFRISSLENLAKLLYLHSNFIKHMFAIIKPFEKKLTATLYQDADTEFLFSRIWVENHHNISRVHIKERERILNTEEIREILVSKKPEKILFLFPSLLTETTIFENPVLRNLLDHLEKEKHILPVKLQPVPYLTLEENVNQSFIIIKDILEKYEYSPKIGFLSFSTGSWIIYYLLYNHHRYFLPKVEEIVLINSPDNNLKLERIILWMGLSFEYHSLQAIQFFRLLTSKKIKVLQEFHRSYLDTPEKKDALRKILSNFPVYKIYSLIFEENTVWSSWLGDGIIEEQSLSYFDDIIENDRTFIVNGVSHLQILSSFELVTILKEIFHLS